MRLRWAREARSIRIGSKHETPQAPKTRSNEEQDASGETSTFHQVIFIA